MKKANWKMVSLLLCCMVALVSIFVNLDFDNIAMSQKNQKVKSEWKMTHIKNNELPKVIEFYKFENGERISLSHEFGEDNYILSLNSGSIKLELIHKSRKFGLPDYMDYGFRKIKDEDAPRGRLFVYFQLFFMNENNKYEKIDRYDDQKLAMFIMDRLINKETLSVRLLHLDNSYDGVFATDILKERNIKNLFNSVKEQSAEYKNLVKNSEFELNK